MITTSAVLEVRAALGEVLDGLGTVGRLLELAQARAADAAAVLGGLADQHHESLVPAELHRAEAELARSRQLISAGCAAVAVIDARL